MDTQSIQQPFTQNRDTKEQNKEITNGKQLLFDPTISHPLKYSWTLWYDAQLAGGKRPSTWGDNIKEIFSFSTIEDFWRLHNNMTSPSQLQLGSTYSLFKNGIEPKWEDPANEGGGKWTAVIQRQKGLWNLDKLWLYLMLACIGQILEEDGSENVCGAVVNVRKGQDKLCLWTRDAENKETVKIGTLFRKILELPDNFPCGYQTFNQLSKSSKGPSNKYEI